MSKIIRVQAQFASVDDLEDVCRVLNLRYKRGRNLTYTLWDGQRRTIADGLVIPAGQITFIGDVAFDTLSRQFIANQFNRGGVKKVVGAANRRPPDNPLHALHSKLAEVKVTQFLTQHNAAYRFVPNPDGRGGRFEYQAATSDGQQGTVSIDVGGDGATTTTVSGIAGPTCADLADPIKSVLGPDATEQLTEGFYQMPAPAWERQTTEEKQWQP